MIKSTQIPFVVQDKSDLKKNLLNDDPSSKRQAKSVESNVLKLTVVSGVAFFVINVLLVLCIFFFVSKSRRKNRVMREVRQTEEQHHQEEPAENMISDPSAETGNHFQETSLSLDFEQRLDNGMSRDHSQAFSLIPSHVQSLQEIMIGRHLSPSSSISSSSPIKKRVTINDYRFNPVIQEEDINYYASEINSTSVLVPNPIYDCQQQFLDTSFVQYCSCPHTSLSSQEQQQLYSNNTSNGY